uniref:Uncharacterized protein n=1 Tax=Anguilla anguilla TaxID=7936 RepID=A0A0E9WAN7_ANGAN
MTSQQRERAVRDGRRTTKDKQHLSESLGLHRRYCGTQATLGKHRSGRISIRTVNFTHGHLGGGDLALLLKENNQTGGVCLNPNKFS